MGFTRREVVASKHAAPAWDKFDAAVPRPLSAFLATPSGMVDHFFKASSKTVARPSGRSKTLSRVGPDSDEETHFLSATIKDSAEVNSRPPRRLPSEGNVDIATLGRTHCFCRQHRCRVV